MLIALTVGHKTPSGRPHLTNSGYDSFNSSSGVFTANFFTLRYTCSTSAPSSTMSFTQT